MNQGGGNATSGMGNNYYIVDKLLKGMMAVSVIMMLSATVSMSIDNIQAGMLVGGHALAVMSLVMPVFVAITMLGSIIANGGSALAARYLGQNKPSAVNELFTLVMAADMIISVLIIACVTPNMSAIASLLGARDPEVNAMMVQYITGLMFSVIPIMFNSSLLYFIRITGNPKLGITSTLVMAVVDISFNALLAGVFKMGMLGLALATGASYLASCIICVVYLLRGKCSLRLTKPHKVRSNTLTLLNLGMPSALSSLTSVIRGVALNLLVATTLGVGVLGVMSAQGAINNIISCATLGIGFAIGPLTGIFFGERDSRSMVDTMKRALRIGLISNVVLAVLVSLLAKPLISLFSLDASLLDMAQRAVWWMAAAIPFSMVVQAFINFYQNAKRVWLANVITVVKAVVFCLSFVYLTIGVLRDNAVWISSLFSDAMALVLIAALAWIVGKKRPASMRDLLLMPKSWDDGTPTLEVALKNNIDDCVGLATRIQKFCDENNAPKKLAYNTALCLEEMAGNVITHGFTDGKDHFIDIKVMLVGDTVRFRIRDDGKEFNPFNYWKTQDSDAENNEEEARKKAMHKNIGIRMVMDVARKVDYRYTMRLNNLFVEVVELKSLVVKSSAAEWERVVAFIGETLALYECPKKVVNAMERAAEELFINIAQFAYAPGEGTVGISIKPLEKGISIRFRDRGVAFDPTVYDDASAASPEEKKIGLLLVRKSTDIFSYERISGSNLVTISKFW